SELANDLGNLLQRSLSMVQRYFDGVIPEPETNLDVDTVILNQSENLLDEVRTHIDAQAFHQALETIWVTVRAANAYVDHQAPWKLIKENPERAGTVLWVLLNVLRQLALILQPFMPDASARMLDQLKISENYRDFSHYGGKANRPASGSSLPKPEAIFPRHFSDSSTA
ncbi:MAG: class I tRNA ligase family protein, partial [Rhodospirillaceae bacterium]